MNQICKSCNTEKRLYLDGLCFGCACDTKIGKAHTTEAKTCAGPELCGGCAQCDGEKTDPNRLAEYPVYTAPTTEEAPRTRELLMSLRSIRERVTLAKLNTSIVLGLSPSTRVTYHCEESVKELEQALDSIEALFLLLTGGES